MLLAHLMLASEPMTLRKLVGVVLGFLGVLLIFKDGLQLPDRTSELAAAVTLVSPFVAALSNVGIKRWGQHLHPYNLTALPMTYAAAGLLVVSVLTEDVANVPWTGTAVGSVMYLALVGSVAAFVIFYTLLKQFTVSTLAFITYVFPIVAIVLGYLLLGETMEMQSLAGATIIAIGIIVATRPYSSRPLRTVRMDGC
jgi:drug/metabolite transporter (DMT)-like permease